jgi:hypothetical protein
MLSVDDEDRPSVTEGEHAARDSHEVAGTALVRQRSAQHPNKVETALENVPVVRDEERDGRPAMLDIEGAGPKDAYVEKVGPKLAID